MRLGIGIPTSNRPKHLKKLLYSIKNQVRSILNMSDIIIVEDSKSDLPASIEQSRDNCYYKELISPATFKVIEGYRKGPQYCHQQILNHFAKKNEIPFILRLDDDIELISPHFINRLWKMINSACDIHAVGGIFINQRSQESPCIGWDYHCQMRRNKARAPFEVSHLYSSYIYRKEIALMVGGFPLYYSIIGHREETDFSLRLKNQGKGRLFVDPQAIAIHHQASFGGVRHPHYDKLCKEDDLMFRDKMAKLGIHIKGRFNGKPMYL
ncbi:MAG: glycosyltransferase family 2 protein [bacterium]